MPTMGRHYFNWGEVALGQVAHEPLAAKPGHIIIIGNGTFTYYVKETRAENAFTQNASYRGIFPSRKSEQEYY